MMTRKEKIDAIIEILQESSNKKSECESKLTVMYQHMVKCYFQPERHTDSWDTSIINSHLELRTIMDKVLKKQVFSKLTKIQNKAVRKALAEMNDGVSKDEKVVISSDSKKKFFDIWTLDRTLDKDFIKDFFSKVPESDNVYYSKSVLSKYIN